MLSNRILRVVLALVVLIVLALAATVGTLFYWLDEDAVKRTVEDLSDKTLGAAVVFDGPVQIERLSSMQVTLPAMTFVKKDEAQTVLGRVARVEAEVSLWSLALGAVHVRSAEISGLEGTLTIPEISGNALFDTTFGSVSLPDDVRINNVTVKNSHVALTVTSQEKTLRYNLTDLYLTLGRVSPEMTAPFEISARYEPIAADGTPLPTSPLYKPALEPPAPVSAQPAAPAEEPQPAAEPSEPTSEPSEPASEPDAAPAQSAAEDAPTAQEVSENAPEAQNSTTEPVPAQEAAEPAPAAPESAASENAPADAAQPPEARQPESGAGEPYETPAPQESKDTKDNGAPAIVSWFTESAHAAETSLFSNVPFVSFAPETNSGLVSARGTLTVSSLNRFVMLEDLRLSFETQLEDTAFTVVAKADRVRFKAEEVSAANVSATVSRPQLTTGDIALGAVDFRMRPGMFESPEMRIGYTDQQAERAVSLEVASSIKADLAAGRTDLESFSARLNVTGDKTLPADFTATLSGSVNITESEDSAKVELSGSFAGSPFSYIGSVADLASPKLRGELMIGDINTATVPSLSNLDWMHSVDFEGTLRVGQIQWRQLSATQLYGKLTVGAGAAELTDIIVNTADGRVSGRAKLADTYDWLFEGHVDGVSIDRVLSGLGAAPVVTGFTTGPVVVSGRGTDAAALVSNAELRLLRGSYRGLDDQAVRRCVMNRSNPGEQVVRADAATPFNEATVRVTIKERMLTASDVTVRSSTLKSTASFTVNLATDAIEGTSRITFAPMQGVPSIHVAASLSGSAAAPAWQFGWEEAGSALARAQGSAVVPARPIDSPAKNEDAQKSIWQSVRDFFNF